MLTKRQIDAITSDVRDTKTSFPLAFQALGDPGRFHIFRLLMRHRNICVTDVAHILNITVSAASQQLRVLERIGLVIKIRRGQMVCYEINQKNPMVKELAGLFKRSKK